MFYNSNSRIDNFGELQLQYKYTNMSRKPEFKYGTDINIQGVPKKVSLEGNCD